MPFAPNQRLASLGRRIVTRPLGAKQRVGLPRTKVIPENQNKALHAWQTSARYWDKYRVLITEMFAPLTSGLVEAAQIGIGQKVLDIGGGSGEPSLTISRIVGPTGSVTYTDPVAGMLESAHAEAARRGLRTSISDNVLQTIYRLKLVRLT